MNVAEGGKTLIEALGCCGGTESDRVDCEVCVDEWELVALVDSSRWRFRD